MKVLAIVSSFRRQGNTDRIVQMIGQQMQAEAKMHNEPLEFETIYPAHMNLKTCLGCRTCFNKGEERCPLKDDLAAILAKMRAADGIIMASPVYVSDVNGVMKTLMDRLAFICHRPEFAGKCVYFVATTGSSPTKHAIRTMQATISWGFHLVGAAGFNMGARMPSDALIDQYTEQTKRIARKLLTTIYRQTYRKPSFVSLMVFKIQQRGWSRADANTIDYRYWQRQGWTDPRREYFIPHRANRLTVAAARFVGGILSRLWA